MGIREIARSCSVSHSTVSTLVARVEASSLEAILYPVPPGTKGNKPMQNMQYIHKELRRPNVTLQLLWEEYKSENSDGYQRSQFCKLYKDWRKTVDVVMRQTHVAGEKLFTDYVCCCQIPSK